MGWLDRLLGRKASAEIANVQSPAFSAAARAYTWGLEQTPESVWENQPYVRTVVSFLARNLAHLGRPVYERRSETSRVREREHPLARVLQRPNPWTSGYELMFGLVADLGLYDRAYWMVERSQSGPRVHRIPPSTVVDHVGEDSFRVEAIVVSDPTSGQRREIPADRLVIFPAWNPVTPTGIPQSPLVALRNVIAEQAAAYEFRRSTWQNGAQVSGTITRPVDAPKWSSEAKERFLADVRAQFGKNGSRAGGTILLEDGMAYGAEQFHSREAEWVEAVKLSMQLVASIYHVNPTMLGLLDNANYSNVKEFRRSLYVDTLGPTMAYIEDRINLFLLPLLDPADDASVYFEFNIDEKLQGSFEEQATALQSAVGGPWMTRDEARALRNLPQVAGADELIVPLNVTTGGLASPRDTAPPSAASGTARSKQRGAVQLKAQPSPGVVQRAGELLTAFFDRQGRSVISRAGASTDLDYIYQSDRWHGEIADVLMQVSILASTDAGRATLQQLGIDPEEWDQGRADAWLRENADGVAAGVNQTVRGRVEQGLAGSELTHTYEVLAGAYAANAAVSHVTAVTGWASIEAPRQQGLEVSKTWNITSSNPRSTHAALDGQTVGADELFSNGGRWPGDTQLSDDERAGCTCELVVNVG